MGTSTASTSTSTRTSAADGNPTKHQQHASKQDDGTAGKHKNSGTRNSGSPQPKSVIQRSVDSILRKEQGGLSSGHTLRFSLNPPSSKTTARLTTAARKSRLPQPRSSLSPNARLSRKEAVNASRLYSMQKRHGLLKGA